MDSEVITSLIGLFIALGVALSLYAKAKAKIRALKELFDELDEALADDKITKEELGRIIEKLKAIVAK